MYAFGIGDLEQVMKIPVPFRKWLIERWNKQKEKEHKAAGNEDPTTPLTAAQKSKIIKQSQQVRADPASFMQGVRNKK